MARKTNPLADRTAGYFNPTTEPDPKDPKADEADISRAKRTYYLPTNTIVLLDEIQLAEFKKTGKKPDLSELVAESIHLLAEQRRAS